MPKDGWARRFSILAVALFALLFALVAAPGLPRAAGDDAYVLALTWHPGFCETRHGREECQVVIRSPDQQLVLHGLWPPRSRDYCGVRPEIIALDRRIEGEKSGRWADLPALELSEAMRERLATVMPGARSGLERHEWYKHGSCITATPEAYYDTALRLAAEVRTTRFGRLLADSAGRTVKTSTLLRGFESEFGQGSGRALTVLCRDGRLEEIRLFLDRGRIGQTFAADSLAPQASVPRGNCGARFDITAAIGG
ncbi:MAG: ribonuclease T [Alphaproteobacteria bacterium]